MEKLGWRNHCCWIIWRRSSILGDFEKQKSPPSQIIPGPWFFVYWFKIFDCHNLVGKIYRTRLIGVLFPLLHLTLNDCFRSYRRTHMNKSNLKRYPASGFQDSHSYSMTNQSINASLTILYNWRYGPWYILNIAAVSATVSLSLSLLVDLTHHITFHDPCNLYIPILIDGPRVKVERHHLSDT